MTDGYLVRRPTEADHGVISPQVNDWWGGRNMQDMLPRLFFQHFAQTSLVAEASDGVLVGFVVAFVSPDHPDQGYIHFVGVSPAFRGSGLGRELYERTFTTLRQKGCTSVKAVTSPVNKGSIAFHAHLGFEQMSSPDGSAVWIDYDGSGEDRIVFRHVLAA